MIPIPNDLPADPSALEPYQQTQPGRMLATLRKDRVRRVVAEE